jgi:hypothetical protein
VPVEPLCAMHDAHACACVCVCALAYACVLSCLCLCSCLCLYVYVCRVRAAASQRVQCMIPTLASCDLVEMCDEATRLGQSLFFQLYRRPHRHYVHRWAY